MCFQSQIEFAISELFFAGRFTIKHGKIMNGERERERQTNLENIDSGSICCYMNVELVHKLNLIFTANNAIQIRVCSLVLWFSWSSHTFGLRTIFEEWFRIDALFVHKNIYFCSNFFPLISFWLRCHSQIEKMELLSRIVVSSLLQYIVIRAAKFCANFHPNSIRVRISQRIL